jgi:hypothetical protein
MLDKHQNDDAQGGNNLNDGKQRGEPGGHE